MPDNKPPIGALIDVSHPLAQGLRHFWLFNEGSGGTCVDIAGSLATTKVGTPVWRAAQDGPVIGLNTSANYLNHPRPSFTGIPAFSVVTRFAQLATSSGTAPDFFGAWDNGTSVTQHFCRNSGSSIQWFVNKAANDGGTYVTFPDSYWDDLAYHTTIFVADGTNLLVYVDGILRGGPTAYAGPYLPADTNNAPWGIGFGRSGGTNSPGANWSFHGYYGCALTASQAVEITANPYAFVRGPETLRLFAPAVSGSQAGTSSGGFTLTGSSPVGVSVVGTGGLTLSGSSAPVPGIVGTGGLTISGSSAPVPGIVGTGGFTLSGSSAPTPGLVGTGGLTLSGSSPVSVGLVGTGGFTLSGSSTVTQPGGSQAGTSSGGFTLSGSSVIAVGLVGTGGFTLSGSSPVSVGLVGTGGFTLSGSSIVSQPSNSQAGTSSGGFTLSGSSLVGVGLVGTGGFVLSGSSPVTGGGSTPVDPPAAGPTAASVTNPLYTGPAELSPPVPYDLAAAIEARYIALQGTDLAALTAFRQSEADAGASLPYAVYKITSGAPELLTSDSQWDDRRVRFEVFAGAQQQADLIRDAVVTAFDGLYNPSLTFTSGLATPFRRVDLAEGKQRGRSSAAGFVFSATANYQVRVRLGQPA